MSYEEDKVSEKLIEINIDGRIFKFKELNGEERDRMLNDTLKVNTEGGMSFDLVKQNQFYLKCVKEAPYEEWKELKDDVEKLNFLNTLKNKIRSMLLKEIKEYHTGLSDVEKK